MMIYQEWLSVLLLTGAGLCIGSFISWMAERKPFLISGTISKKPDLNFSNFSLLPWLTVLFAGSIFFSLSILELSAVEAGRQAFFFSFLLAVTVFDLKYRLIPNRLVLIGITVWLIFVVSDSVPFIDSLLAGTCAAFILLLIRWLGFWLYQQAGMGIGDVKLLFIMGLFLEWEVFWILYLAITAGGFWAGAGLWLKKTDKNSRLPFAPFLLLGSLLAMFIFPYNQLLALWM
ncbi:MAG: A24 family peptidase [Balneolaceae bacterium]